MSIEPCNHPGCTSSYAGPHTWHVETFRVVQLTPAGETLAVLITGCTAREANRIARELGDGFHVRIDPAAIARAA